jgi:hypothetical protein
LAVGFSTRRHRLRSVLGLLCIAGMVAPAIADDVVPPLSGPELATIVRSMSLSALYGDAGAVARGVCAETRLRDRWPKGALDTLGDRQADVLREAVEVCSATGSGMRLVAEVRLALQERVARLEKFNAAMMRCFHGKQDDAATRQCLAAAAGRPLSATELQALVSAARSMPPRR